MANPEELRKQGLPATVESGADGRVRLAVAPLKNGLFEIE